MLIKRNDLIRLCSGPLIFSWQRSLYVIEPTDRLQIQVCNMQSVGSMDQQRKVLGSHQIGFIPPILQYYN